MSRKQPFQKYKAKRAVPRPERAQAATPAAERERIAKVMARAGLTSRREAEVWIAAGRVSVNGVKLDTPAHTVGPNDKIEVDGEPLPTRERTRLFLYNKPKGLITTNSDPEGRATIFQNLPKSLPRVVSVGRLDFNSEGLLLLTNDGGLARTLELPSTGWLRRYRVRAMGRGDQTALDRLKKGVTVEGISYGPIHATLDREQGANLWLTVDLREGKNREIRKALGHIGLNVNRLIRVSFGPFQLGEIAPGQVEEVKTRTLQEQLGESLMQLSHSDFNAPLREAPKPVKPPERVARASTGKPREREPQTNKKPFGKPRRDDRAPTNERSPGRYRSKEKEGRNPRVTREQPRDAKPRSKRPFRPKGKK